MNELISQQMPLVDAALAQRQQRQSVQDGKAVPAISETGRPNVQADASSKRDEPVQDTRKLSEVVQELNSKLQDMQRGLKFSVDDSSGRIVVKVIDLGTDEVIRQIPSEEMMAIIRNAGESPSMLLDEEV